MADLPETATYDAGVYQLETTDAVVGGATGKSNAAARNLANRTKWLKQQVDALLVNIVQATESLRGTAEIATQAEVNAGADDQRVVTPLKLRFGFALYFGTTDGYLVLPAWMGSWKFMVGVYTIVNPNALELVALPLAFDVGYVVVGCSGSVNSTGGATINNATSFHAFANNSGATVCWIAGGK